MNSVHLCSACDAELPRMLRTGSARKCLGLAAGFERQRARRSDRTEGIRRRRHPGRAFARRACLSEPSPAQYEFRHCWRQGGLGAGYQALQKEFCLDRLVADEDSLRAR